jgi:hypothetical protein
MSRHQLDNRIKSIYNANTHKNEKPSDGTTTKIPLESYIISKFDLFSEHTYRFLPDAFQYFGGDHFFAEKREEKLFFLSLSLRKLFFLSRDL